MRENLNIYAVGDFGARDRWNPEFQISEMGAWQLLEALVNEPGSARTAADKCQIPVATTEAMLSPLADLGVVRRSGDNVSLGFAWFTAADQDALQARSIPLAREIADRILGRREEIDRHLGQVQAARWTGLPDLRFAVVGCFGLDWGGLEALKASGHLVHDKLQPGDRRYVMYVEEPVEIYQQRDYTGSHTMWMNPAYRWTSFGDHSGRRFGLPDLVWALGGAVIRAQHIPEESRNLLGDFVLEAVAAQTDVAAEALIEATKGNFIQHPLLTAAHALSEEGPSVPVFVWNEDGDHISQVVKIVQEVTVATVSAGFESLRADLAALTPLRHGVPFAECFNPIWHAVFGHANRMLAEDGFLADPEPRRPGEGRYRWWLTAY